MQILDVIKCLLGAFILSISHQIKRVSSASISNPLMHDKAISAVVPNYIESKTAARSYFNSTILVLSNHPKDISHIDYDSCNIDISVNWITSVGSSVFSTPVIVPMGKQGKKQMFISTYYDYIEMISSDGSKPLGWPLSLEGSIFQGSPIVFDIDGDGHSDLCVVDKNANIFWIRVGEIGQYLEDYHIQIPRLKVKRDWYKGIDPHYVDKYAAFSMFEHQTRTPLDPAEVKPSNKVKIDDLFANVFQDTYPELNNNGEHRRLTVSTESSGSIEQIFKYISNAVNSSIASESQGEIHGRRLQEQTVVDRLSPETTVAQDVPEILAVEQVDGRERIENSGIESVAAADSVYARVDSVNLFGEGGGHGGGEFGEDDKPPGIHYQADDYDVAANAHDSGNDNSFPGEGGQRGIYRSFDDGFHYYMAGGGLGGVVGDQSEHVVYIDPHVLGTPQLVDINGDGHMEVVVAISYYFDHNLRSSNNSSSDASSHGWRQDINASMYVAGGLACWDVIGQDWLWLVHLDLTTDFTNFKAYIHSSPTIADLDGDGRYEILIGTSLGLLYLLDGDTGFVRRHFPMQFHAIEAQIVVADLTDTDPSKDGENSQRSKGREGLEIIVCDMAGNVVAVNVHGEVIWDVQVAGSLPYTPTIGDVDGDGQLDVVVVSVTDLFQSKERTSGDGGEFQDHLENGIRSRSYIYAINGASGEVLPGYPISLPKGGRVTGPVILIDLHDHTHTQSTGRGPQQTPLSYSDPALPPWMVTDEASILAHSHTRHAAKSPVTNRSPASSPSGLSRYAQDNRGLHMLVTSFDGHVYIIWKPGDKQSSLYQSSRGNGVGCAQRIDLGEHLASTPLVDDFTGNGYLDIIVGTLNGQVYSFETSISAHPLNSWASYPKYRSSSGMTHGSVGISVPEVEKINLRYSAIKVSRSNSITITFDIWDTRSTSELDKRVYSVIITRGTNRAAVMARETYNEPGRYSLTIPVSPPEEMILVVGMTTKHGLYYEDSAWVSVSTRFYVWLKYLPTIPVLVLCLPLLFMRKPKRVFE